MGPMPPTDSIAELKAAVEAAARALRDGEPTEPTPTLDRPPKPDLGDYSSNAAMLLAGPLGDNPRAVAERLRGELEQRLGARLGSLERIDVAGPGFLNFFLSDAWFRRAQSRLLAAGEELGPPPLPEAERERILVEFVSANPTGPLHVGGSRGAAYGDAIVRLLEAVGHEVEREYYINDGGSQIDRFAESIAARMTGASLPEGGYEGDYVSDIAERLLEEGVEPSDRETVGRRGVALVLDGVRQTLERFGVRFGTWISERALYERGEVEQALAELERRGHTYRHEGATWLRTTDFGDDKDRVIVRSAQFGGQPTYFCSDLAYYIDKRKRGADKVVILLGADHHGYVGRMRSMVAGMGENPDETLEIIIGQMVNVQGARMAKRAGNLVTLDDLIAAIGVDAGRYNLVRSSMDSPIDIDLDLWAAKTNDNPVYYVQYAHARLSSLQRNAADLGIERGTEYDAALLTHERETDLLTELGEFPRVITAAAELREPHRVARYLEELAGTYHRFYDACRVLPRGDEEVTPVTIARLWLCEATRTVLANGLGLLGVSAPTRM